ncbi:MAG TPA: hypothetical protein VK632_14130, partial [Verrucomicrobiae bacterium]|nr:hypothetical protein [Verrucomicrobiae bacterium]
NSNANSNAITNVITVSFFLFAEYPFPLPALQPRQSCIRSTLSATLREQIQRKFFVSTGNDNHRDSRDGGWDIEQLTEAICDI